MNIIVLAQLNPIVGDISGNCKKILSSIASAKEKGADLILFPELALTGYPPEDLLLLPNFIQAVDEHLEKIALASIGVIVVVGCCRKNETSREKPLFNSAAVCIDGKIAGYQDKILLPNYDVFDERRYFEPGRSCIPFNIHGKQVAVTICEDIWEHTEQVKYTDYHVDPIALLHDQKVDLLLNLSASPFCLGKFDMRKKVVLGASKTLNCPVLLCNQVGANDSLIFDGRSLACTPKGVTYVAQAFAEDLLSVRFEKPTGEPSISEEEELYHALVLGIRDYFFKQGFQSACLGLSGGIDSAVVAALAVEALGKERVFGLLMPSRFSSLGSISDALALSETLGIKTIEVPIEEPFDAFLTLLSPVFKERAWDVTEENLQARIRGMLLMAISNKFGHLVLSTGNKSEMAMGYSTLYGDMCGGLSVLADVCKGQVYALAHWINREKEVIPKATINKPPSAELRAGQLDSDTLPEYVVIDQVVKSYVEEHLCPKSIADKFSYPLDLVEDLILKIHRNEYKRRQSAPLLRVSSRAFSVGRKFPIVQGWV